MEPSAPCAKTGLGQPARPRRPLCFRRATEGATAVEFALIAVPLIGLLFAIIETALAFWASQVLETAVASAARQIYTGGFQSDPANAPLTAAQRQVKFKALVCANVSALFDCTGRVSVDVRSVSNFSGATLPLPVTGGTYDPSSYVYAPPTSSAIGIVRASMEYPIHVKILPRGGPLSNGNALLVATATFMTEPYSP